MKISPLDIQQQQFKGKLFGGLDQDDVDGFLQQISQELESLIRENTDLKEQLRKASSELEENRQRETTLRETMLAAQRITEEMKINSQKEANLRITEAELKADKITADAENRLIQLNNRIQELRREKLQFESSIKSVIDAHYKLLSLDAE